MTVNVVLPKHLVNACVIVVFQTLFEEPSKNTCTYQCIFLLIPVTDAPHVSDSCKRICKRTCILFGRVVAVQSCLLSGRPGWSQMSAAEGMETHMQTGKVLDSLSDPHRPHNRALMGCGIDRPSVSVSRWITVSGKATQKTEEEEEEEEESAG